MRRQLPRTRATAGKGRWHMTGSASTFFTGASQHISIDVDSLGYPSIAYFDQNSDRIQLAIYCGSPNCGLCLSLTDWNCPAVGAGSYHGDYLGQYASIAVDDGYVPPRILQPVQTWPGLCPRQGPRYVLVVQHNRFNGIPRPALGYRPRVGCQRLPDHRLPGSVGSRSGSQDRPTADSDQLGCDRELWGEPAMAVRSPGPGRSGPSQSLWGTVDRLESGWRGHRRLSGAVRSHHRSHGTLEGGHRARMEPFSEASRKRA